MHHPGPPRFVSVGDAIELAPRDPDPDAAYEWAIERAPTDSTASVVDEAVQWFQPDEPGEYVLSLSAPDGTHRLTVRCFPGDFESSARPESRSGQRSGAGLEAEGEGEVGESGYRHANRSGDFGPAGRPRIHLDARVEDETLIVEADPRPHPRSGETAGELDVVFTFDDRDDLSADAATLRERTLEIPVDRLPDRARIHAVSVGDAGHSVADAIELRRESEATPGGEAVHVRRLYDPPPWSTDAAYYEVYVRTFAPDAPEGEVLSAITDRLDHLEDLGVDVVWLTPVLENDHAPHGYNITDFFSIAEDLGDREDLEALVDAAHERDMRVLFDLVLNHSARAHPHFQDADGNPDSEFYDWYEWQDDGEPGTYFDWQYIANFDFSHLPVRRHLLDAIDTWAPLVDGFRCDMAWAVPNTFWREVRERVKDRDPEFLLLDETIPYIPDFQEGMFDVHFDSTTYARLRSVGDGWESAASTLDAIDQRTDIGFPDHAGFLLYLENHDETRYLVECDRPAARAGAGALCTLPGAPLVYAGQEFGQLGKRDDLVWDAVDETMVDHYRTLLSLRRTMPALGHDAGTQRIDHEVMAGEDDRVLAFARGDPPAADAASTPTADGAPGDVPDPEAAEAALVVCNFAEGEAEVALGPNHGGYDAVAGEALDDDGAVTVDDVVVLPTSRDALVD